MTRAQLWVLALLPLCSASAPAAPPSAWEREIVYQIFPRSYFDSNGDRIGDFNGIAQRLDHVTELGATAILLQPILKSRLYHNYFPDDFFQTDPAFGTNAQFFDMVKAAHRRHLKVVLDMELQYVASEHPWYVAAQRDPSSPEGKCLLPQSGFMGQRAVPSYDGSRVPIATVNTNNPEVLKTWEASFLYWAAPTGRPQDGVDGFRLDHMMDDLDNRHTNANMFERVWKPLEAEVRRAKPGTFFLAEQSDWGLGGAVFQQGGVDAAYAIPMYLALKSLDAAKLAQGIKDELAATPEGKTQFVFVEDHDVERYASVVQSDPKLLRLGAVFMLTSKGTPSIYYGQELGMKGIQLHGHSDGNDIPVRLAFRWSRQIDAPGTATWYGQGPWNDPSLSRSGDGISLEEERPDPDSLYSFYRKLIALRRHDKALTDGDERLLDGLPSGVVGFVRTQGQEQVKVLLNLGSAPASVNLSGVAFRDLLTGKPSGSVVDLQGHDFRILQSHVRT